MNDVGPVHSLVVDRFRVDCVCYGQQLHFEPYEEIMSSRFTCCRVPGATDCQGCPVCSKCGQLRCTCGFLGISIEVKKKGTVIETVPLRDRIASNS